MLMNMLKRVRTKIGDVFSVPVSDTEKRYIQLIAFDLYQLNSDVIRAFKKVYLTNEKPSLEDIISGEVDFYAHTTTKAGVKLDLWEKTGYISEVGELQHILFKSFFDLDLRRELAKGEAMDPIKPGMTNWGIWYLGDERATYVKKTDPRYVNAERGSVKPPCEIVERLKTGKYAYLYVD